MDRRALVAAFAAGAAALAVLRLWQGSGYWNFAEGVYALTARDALHGGDLYGQIAVAQPPGMLLVGTLALAVHDSITTLRIVVGLVQLLGGLLAAAATWRLSGNRAATIATPALVLLSPWAIHDHAILEPETVVGPLLIGGALLAARPRTAAAGGALAALAVGVKLPFLLPVIGIVACAADRRRAAAGAAAALAAAVAIGLAVFGTGLFTDTVIAQSESGWKAFGDLPGLFAQAGWNLAPALLAAAVLLWTGTRDPALARVWLGLVAGMLLTLVSMVKVGTTLNVCLSVEAVLAPAALAGAAASRRFALPILAVVALQSAVLMAEPVRTAFPFLYPLSVRGAYQRIDTGPGVERRIAATAACPPDAVLRDAPYLAFIGHRAPPGGQPDQFLMTNSETVAADHPPALRVYPPPCS